MLQTMEKRQTPIRPRTLKGARIVFNQGFSTIDCVVRNLTQGGARLQIESTSGLPDQFTLIFDSDRRECTCSVRWRKGNALGVQFID